MQRTDDIGWLSLGLSENRVIAEMGDPVNQYPAFCVYMGGRTKDSCLRQLYPYNNIKRHSSVTQVKQRCDMGSLNTTRPVLFADGDFKYMPSAHSSSKDRPKMERLISWDASSAKNVLCVIWARLVLLFVDIICIFADDFADLLAVADFLLECFSLQASSSLPSAVHPRVIIVFQSRSCYDQKDMQDVERFYCRLSNNSPNLTECFSAIHMARLEHNHLSGCARYQRLRALIRDQLDDMYTVPLFRLAFEHTAENICQPFDFVKATRANREVPSSLGRSLAHYLEIGAMAGICYEELASSISSAFIMDHYVPGMLATEPGVVYQTLYRFSVLDALQISQTNQLGKTIEELASVIECHLVQQFDQLDCTGQSSLDLRREQLRASSGRMCKIRSSKICLICLFRLFGTPAPDTDYRFTISACLCCLYQRPLVIDILPPTMSPTVLAIDGGGVRGVIPLEFLTLVQESLGSCPLQDLVDLGVGTSSGGLSILGLFTMEWDIRKCAAVFDRMARRIFHQRRTSLLARASQAVFGRNSFFGSVHKWFLWILYDSCDDGLVFDVTLKEVFTENKRIFDSLHKDGSRATYSRTKSGVVATSIARETGSFVFGNFNGAEGASQNCGNFSSNVKRNEGYEIVRPIDTKLEPCVWEAFLPPVDIRGVGSFQDGGLWDNLAADIARRLCRQIWPSRKHPAKLVSMGTGVTERNPDRSPHFRHVFRDGFLRRGFDAWMSSMDTESTWLEMMGQVEDAYKEDYLRLNIPLRDVPSGIDTVEVMDEYRNLVIGAAGSARMAREAATALLVARFYFVLESLPEETGTPFWCYGTDHTVQGSCQAGLDYITDSETIGPLKGHNELCLACGRYRRQYAPFGRLDHGRSGSSPCESCDGWEILGNGMRRKRSSAGSRNSHPKKLRSTDEIEPN
ncbi:patatin-like phospholipase [Aspergillus novoparasiticus]|uniref:Patatin-like phospholipase n=1 Tax=Aspergillus novoparasiticus TaxID=986946 RepID=A0A5N6E6S4_9EURO|nr:patatin-like phospholipase [Aspergillus novoparasiticus]